MTSLSLCFKCSENTAIQFCCSLWLCSNCYELHECTSKFNNSSTDVTNSLSHEEQLKQDCENVINNLDQIKAILAKIPLNADLLTLNELKHLLNITIDRSVQYSLLLQGTTLTKYNIYNNHFTYNKLPEDSETILSSLCYNSENIFISGGLKNFIPTNSIMVLRFNDCSVIRNFKLDQARYYCASICYENFLFVVGGLDSENNELDTIEWFDLDQEKKGTLAMSKPRGKPSILALNGKIYIAGKDSGKFVDVLDVKEMKIKVKKFTWAQGPILMIAEYCNKILVLGESGITSEKSGVMLKTWNKIDQMWSQQVLAGLDNFLYFFDYFSGQLVRIYVADFRFNIT